MRRVTIKPAEGRRVLMADGRPLPADGASVLHDLFARRLLSDGDAVLVSDEQEAPEETKPAPAAAAPKPAATAPTSEKAAGA